MPGEKPFYYGGQAVIEGVMMRGRKALAVAVRQSNGEIKISQQAIPSLYKGNLRQVPFLRGVIVLIETMVLGIQALFYSAQAAAADQTQEEISPGMLWGTAAVSIVLGVGIFFVGPLLITNLLIYPHVPSSILANLIEGVMRLAIFILYLRLITLMPDIKVVFAYHGAEHKAVNALESGVPLEVQAVRGYSTAHTRCGTSFLLVVLVLAIFVFSLLGKPPLWLGIISRIVLLPVIAAIGYEVIRFAAGHVESSRIV
ncbi:MAG TPA: DUF1385 domain-containing protein, partial [Dehalococcoidia bacterium]|nr:DUF1385 domain-containing protein [Dehalococcoidia bacterium]